MRRLSTNCWNWRRTSVTIDVTGTSHHIEVSGIRVEVVRKDIKNLHLGVYPPHGRVRVAVPRRIDDEAVRLAVVSKLAWIRRRQREFESQPRQSERQLLTGESHYFMGRRYLLDVIEQQAAPHIFLRNNRTMELRVRPSSSQEKRNDILQGWYRARLREQLPALVARWEPKVGVKATDVRIKKMKTRWGTCNIPAGHIWLNLELAKKPSGCVEYILVHEMVHFLERHHNERFRKLMDRFMPQWRLHRNLLNREPLAHEDWEY